MKTSGRDQFLSEEDLDLQNMSEAELVAWWNLWLRQAQATNDLDQYEYSQGVFVGMQAPHGQPKRSCSASPTQK